MANHTVTLTTIDGLDLEADFASAEGPTVRGAVTIAHPHPLYGGDRFHPIVTALFDEFPRRGFHALRFDFRGAAGRVHLHDDGDAERLDVAAAVDFLAGVVDEGIWVGGYSFGALVSLSVVEPRVEGWFAIAPPVAGRDVLAARDPRPKFLVVPRHDQFAPPDSIDLASWIATSLEIVESADHFLVGATDAVARSVADRIGLG